MQHHRTVTIGQAFKVTGCGFLAFAAGGVSAGGWASSPSALNVPFDLAAHNGFAFHHLFVVHTNTQGGDAKAIAFFDKAKIGGLAVDRIQIAAL